MTQMCYNSPKSIRRESPIVNMKRIISYLLLMLFVNVAFLIRITPGTAAAVFISVALAVFYICFHFVPIRDPSPQRRLRILNGGIELALAAIVCSFLEALVYLYILIKGTETGVHILVINALVCAGLLFILLANGLIRIFACSGQLGIMPRIGLLLFWWMPVVNIILLGKFISISRREYKFTTGKHKLNMDRKHEELCKTKYPILMVHGIFFRDWKNFNYWGRIPKELEGSGATIYYGNHQSSASVEQCAGELKQCILDIVEKTGCEKVNIIAHSKGGLDSRYAVSCLGMGKHVASLTTINTPHQGCNYVHKLLNKISPKKIAALEKKYASLFTKLGDENPDFLSGLKDLTDTECSRLNGIMKDDPDVLYQSVGSRMRSPSSAVFPLNAGYCIMKFFGGGDNDGLVSTNSMEWGQFLGVLSPKGKRGISHGDVIDLTRKNIEGFDVCEFYVDLVNKLKLKGL